MSRLAERLARAEAKLAEADEVIVLTIYAVPRPFLIGGSPANRVAEIKKWYAKHDVPMTKEHADEVRAYERAMKQTKPSTKKPAKPSTLPSRSSRRSSEATRRSVRRGKETVR